MSEFNSETIEELDLEQMNDLKEILHNTREQGQRMEQMIKNQIQVKDELIDKLHDKLEFYKQDHADRFITQVMKAVIKVHKDMGKRMASAKWNELSADDYRREYTYVFEDITDLLEQQNIDPYKSEPGDRFDPRKHQVFKIEPTENRLLDKTIKMSVNEGYTKDAKILIAERVIVYQFKEKGVR